MGKMIRFPRVPLPRQVGGVHKDQRRPARVNAKVLLRKGPYDAA